MAKAEFNEADFDWVSLHEDLNKIPIAETTKQRMARKFKENPLIPIGCLATATALTVGLWSFNKGDRRMSQYMMRARVAAQGFTVLALVVGLGISSSRHETT